MTYQYRILLCISDIVEFVIIIYYAMIKLNIFNFHMFNIWSIIIKYLVIRPSVKNINNIPTFVFIRCIL
jgi:hypothetical protein